MLERSVLESQDGEVSLGVSVLIDHHHVSEYAWMERRGGNDENKDRMRK
jgi:hypothetical protein